MKGYKFKLEAVLKIRKLKEDACKMDIGRIQVQINKLKNDIAVHNDGIRQAYESQEKGLEKGLSGQELRFHPYFVGGKRADIEKIQSEINMLNEEVTQKYDHLKFLRADLKVVDEMKQKDKKKYKKDLEKKQYQELEEQVQNWKQFNQ
jgi:flagellar export protein FliJ